MTRTIFRTDNPKIHMTTTEIKNGAENYILLDCPRTILSNGIMVDETIMNGRRNHHGAVMPNVHYRIYAYKGVYFKVRRTQSAAGSGDWSGWKLLWIAPMSEKERKDSGWKSTVLGDVMDCVHPNTFSRKRKEVNDDSNS